jgi:hypothetical protein
MMSQQNQSQKLSQPDYSWLVWHETISVNREQRNLWGRLLRAWKRQQKEKI